MIHSILQRFLSNPILRNITILVSGTAFAQGVIALSLPILTRLYTPDDFGLLGVYAALIGIFSTISCLRFNIAIPIPESDVEGAHLLVLAVMSATGFALVLSLLCWAGSAFWVGLLNVPALLPYLWLVPLGVFLAGLYTALQYWASRKKRFGVITRTRISRALLGSGTQLGVGAVSGTPFGLLFGHLIYSGFGVVGLLRSLWAQDRAVFVRLRWRDMMDTLRRNRRFPLISTPEALCDASYQHGPLLMMAAMLQDATVGFLFLALRIIAIPIGLMGGAVSQVYLSEAPEKYRAKTLGAFTRKTYWGLFRVGVGPLILAGILCPFAFPIVFGDDWQTAGFMVSWMVPWFILQFAASPVSVMFHVIGRQDVAFALQLFGTIFTNGGVFIALLMTPEFAIPIYAGISAVFYIIYSGLIMLYAMRLNEGDA